tara:strand:+ start:11308 stop:12228 length:921 start_codon:yes stop_codon:yes gene_type:complete
MSIIFKIKRRILQKLFFSKSLSYWQKYGINITRNHYYSNIPDLKSLNENNFKRKIDIIGIDFNEEEQKALLKRFSKSYRQEYDAWPKNETENKYDFHIGQTSFRSVDSQILHCMIRDLKPSVVMEVGSGYTTMITAKALLMNQEETKKGKAKFTSIEPYPNEVLQKGIPGLDEIIGKGIQELPTSYFDVLKENDVLFLDSTHTVKIGGDVNYEILELLPRLNKGVIVHIHDIFLPYEYPEPWITTGERIWAEQYLLHAFLINNDTYKILWTSHNMFREYPDLLKSEMNYFEEDVPYKGSIWLQKVK